MVNGVQIVGSHFIALDCFLLVFGKTGQYRKHRHSFDAPSPPYSTRVSLESRLYFVWSIEKSFSGVGREALCCMYKMRGCKLLSCDSVRRPPSNSVLLAMC